MLTFPKSMKSSKCLRKYGTGMAKVADKQKCLKRNFSLVRLMAYLVRFNLEFLIFKNSIINCECTKH